MTQFVNKSLVSIANRPALSHLIEQFPPDAEFVIALGYKGHLVREFLTLAYPNRRFFFAQVSPFEGPASGLGLSLLNCRQYLQQPFVFISCDTLVEEQMPPPDKNWMGYAEVGAVDAYRTLRISSGVVQAIVEKGEGGSPQQKAYIGLAGIHHYQGFWEAIEAGGRQAVETGEAHGMRNLLSSNILAQKFTWHDTGSPVGLVNTRNRYREFDEPNILEKANEAIWFVDDAVIKFSDDKQFIANRVKRVELLEGFVPAITGSQAHMYRYTKVHGKVMSKVVTLPLFERLLEHCQLFWRAKSLTVVESTAFKDTCLNFYRNKTFERLDLFYKISDHKDGSESINGKPMPELGALLKSLDWDWLTNGLPGRFHGDLHFENILWCESEAKFVFLDWRQDFGGDLGVGDIYYDFAKLLHGLIVSHELIASNLFGVDWKFDIIKYDLCRKQRLVECERYFLSWLNNNGYDRKKVWVLTALIYLNIAALHHNPYNILLFALGKDMLCKELEIQS